MTGKVLGGATLGSSEVRRGVVRQGGHAGRRSHLEATVHRVLKTGILLAAIFLTAGLLASFAEHHALPRSTVATGAIPRGLLHLDPGAIVTVGIALLVLTPVVRVFGSILAFVRSREPGFAAITTLVLLLMAAGFLLGVG